MAKFPPTAEQLEALRLFLEGKSLVIQAGAGAGKTSSLVLLAENSVLRGQYIAFNGPIVKEARTVFPSTVNCSTAHSLAYKAMMNPDFERRLRESRRIKPMELAKMMKVDPMWITNYAGEQRQLGAGFLAGLALRTVDQFCNSADTEITARHVPKVDGLDEPIHAQHGLSKYPVNAEVAKAIVPVAKRAWKDIRMYDGALPFKHGHYLKMWQLSGPKIAADYILFDEAQDANPVLQAIVAAQTHAQIVWVGDSQQQIYSFTGAINALEKVTVDAKTFLRQSFRFGPAIARVANVLLDKLDAELRIIGFDKIKSVVTWIEEPDVLLTRTNAGAVRAMLEAQAAGKKVHLVGGSKHIADFARAAKDLMEGKRVEHPELACFESWDEVLSYVEEDEESGGDLKVIVKLIEDFEVEAIVAAVSIASQERHADLVISTAHKSKGKQWPKVKIGNDFPSGEKAKGEELRLLYVAVTRAQTHLDISECATLTAGVEADYEKPIVRQHRAPIRRSEYVGTVGAKVELVLTVERSSETTWGFLTKLRDADGNGFAWFAREEYAEGTVVSGEWKVKKHETYRDEKETAIFYPSGVEVVPPGVVVFK